jgi:3',5'-cyclic AMP phosphodiesterase CpdA
MPGEHDASLDQGKAYKEFFGETTYTFDHKGVHFIALDNVSDPAARLGDEQLEWLKADLAKQPKDARIVVFTHRPLFDLKPEWEWFTSDGDAVMNVLAPYENVTVLYGHIHREDARTLGNARHLAARSLIFAFPAPAEGQKKPIAFDAAHPFRNLGLRLVHAGAGPTRAPSAGIDEVELTMREHSGTEGFQQLLRPVAS